mgnify:CR=1 FL=1
MLSLMVNAQGVDVTCLQVLSNGEVQVNWSDLFESQLDPNLQLIRYEVYRSSFSNPTNALHLLLDASTNLSTAFVMIPNVPSEPINSCLRS